MTLAATTVAASASGDIAYTDVRGQHEEWGMETSEVEYLLLFDMMWWLLLYQ